MNPRLSEPGSDDANMGSAPQPDYDLIIVGAGLTGLSVACWLLQLAQEEQAV